MIQSKQIKKYKTSWYFSNNGYVTGTINGKNIYFHQYLLNYHGNGKGQNSIDHINRNKLDNRLENFKNCRSIYSKYK